MAAVVLRGDAAHLPLEDGSTDLIVTSPPYWALRSYTDDGEHYEGQIGSEETWQEYLANLLRCTQEWARVLKPEGSIFVVLGDKYSERGHGPNRGTGTGRGPQATHLTQTRGPLEKSLMLLPERYRIACVDQLGLIARAVIEWAKPNGLPESVTDRVRRSHEDVVHLVRQPRYYSAVDAIREDVSAAGLQRRKYAFAVNDTQRASRNPVINGAGMRPANPLGKLPGSVWDIPSQPLAAPDHLGVDHFAAFPMELPRRIILGWSPSAICLECGEGRRPVSVRGQSANDRSRTVLAAEGRTRRLGLTSGLRTNATAGEYPAAAIVGYACSCAPYTDHPGTGKSHKRTGNTMLDGEGWASTNELNGSYANYERIGPWREYHLDGWTPPPTRPAVVVDPFAGTGTTMLTASVLSRIGIGIDRSGDYCRLARWRCSDPSERARALGVPKPPPVPEGQLAFDGLEAS